MNDSFFSGAFADNSAKFAADSRLECKICWYVYDPAIGDEVWQIQPGTAFSQLPDHWSCPVCSAEKQHFLLLAD